MNMQKALKAVPEEEQIRLLQEYTKDDVLDAVKVFLSHQLQKDHEGLKKYLLGGISEWDRKSDQPTSPENGRFNFNFSFDTQEELTAKGNKVLESASEEDYNRFIMGYTKKDILGFTEVWLLRQPEEEQERLKKYFLAGIFELGRKSDQPYSITFRKAVVSVNEEPELPPYTK